MVYMVRGYVHAFLLILCLVSTVVFADNEGNMPVISGPSVSITSYSQAEEQASLASEAADASGNSPVIQATNKIFQGDTIFIGENHLDVSSALGTAGSIAWWQNENTNLTAPDAVLPVPTPEDFFVDPAYFSLKSGDWYQWVDNQKGSLTFRVADPSLYLRIWDATKGEDITGKSIPMGNLGNFVIESNLYPIVNRTGYSPADSQIKINMTNPSGEKYSFLVGAEGAEHPLTKLQVNSPLWYWIGPALDHTIPSPNDGWNTSETYLNGTKIYKPGVYSVRVECNVNNIKNTYKAPDGSDYANKTVSMVQTVELIDVPEKKVSIQAAGTGPFFKGSVVSLSGLNTITDTTYLFMAGPGLPAAGGSLLSPLVQVQSDVPATFDSALVSESDTWVFSWTIPHTLPETGTYILYAASEPKNLINISETISDSLPVTISSGDSSSLHLVSGWNFISTPDVLASGHNTMAIFSGVNSSGHSIFTYNGSSSSWITLKAEDPFYPLNGIWTYSVSPTDIPLVIDNFTVTPRVLAQGWNCVGILSPERTAGTVLQPLGSLWSYLVGYNATVQQYTEPLVVGDPAVNTTIMHTKEGYWLYLKDNATFTG